MSRRGLHTPKAKAQNVAYGPHVSSTVVHWKFEELDSRFALDDAERANKTPFVTKTWIKTENPSVLDDGADETIAFNSVLREVVEVASTTNSDLTASDIRGAVGGEAIPGIASDTQPEAASAASAGAASAGAANAGAASAASAADAASAGAASASAEPTAPPAVKAEVDGEGDIIMS